MYLVFCVVRHTPSAFRRQTAEAMSSYRSLTE